MSFFWEEFILVCSVFGVLLVFFALCIFMFCGAETIFEQKSCSKSAELYNAETKFHWATGCFIKHNGRFIPMDEYEKLLIPNHQMGNGEIKVSMEDEKFVEDVE